jgi:5-methylcytosine-specific restriction endonuclease McrA
MGNRCCRYDPWRGAIHHRKKRSQGGEDTLDNLEYLCGGCHDQEHGIHDA